MIQRIYDDPRYGEYSDRLTLGLANFSDLNMIAQHQAFPNLFKAPRRKNQIGKGKDELKADILFADFGYNMD